MMEAIVEEHVSIGEGKNRAHPYDTLLLAIADLY